MAAEPDTDGTVGSCRMGPILKGPSVIPVSDRRSTPCYFSTLLNLLPDRGECLLGFAPSLALPLDHLTCQEGRMSSRFFRREPPEMVFRHNCILNITQLVLNEFDLLNEPRGRPAGTQLRQLGGVARSFCPNAYAVPLGI